MTTKAEADWSEEEQKLVKDYEKRVRELQEEREKFRKVKLQTVKDLTIESNPRPGTYGTKFLSSKLKQEINSAMNWQDANYNENFECTLYVFYGTANSVDYSLRAEDIKIFKKKEGFF